jgi:hypothetical protein
MTLLTTLQLNLESAAGDISASADQTLASVSQSASASVIVQATAAQTLASVTQSASASVVVDASAAQSLASVSQTAAAAVVVAASAAQTLASVSQSAAASVIVEASASQTLASIAQSATLGELAPITAEAAQTLDSVSQTAELATVATRPPKAETGGAMAGSGRWRRADDDTVFLRAKPATGRGSRTRPVSLEWPCLTIEGRGRTSSASLAVVVPLSVDCAHGTGRARPASVKTNDIVEVLRVIELLTTRKAA